MKNWKNIIGFAMVGIIIFTRTLLATTHVVQFGGSLGFIYSPSSLTALVGDTIKWEGDFSAHPLSSTTVPSGAQSFQMASGTSFAYHITVAGSYAYRCDLHFTIGMVGAFTANESTVRYNLIPAMQSGSQTIRIGIQEFLGKPFVSLSVLRAGLVSVKVYDISGHELATILDGAVTKGAYSVPLEHTVRASGYYFIKQRGSDGEHVIRFFLAH